MKKIRKINQISNHHNQTRDCAGSVLSLLLFLLSLPVFAQTPAAPTGLTVTATSGSAIGLTWTAPAGETNVRGYNVYRCESPCTLNADEHYLTWVSQGAGDPHPAPTRYTDSSVSPGTTYVYAVGASVNNYVLTAWTNQVTVTAEAPPQAPAPTGLTAQDTTGTGTYLTWNEPMDDNGIVNGYNIYRCEGTDCEPEYIAWVYPNWHNYYGDYTLSPGTTYRYAVASSRGQGTESAWSNVVTVMTITQAPAPAGLGVTGTRGSISLNWTAPADDDNGALLGYNVYRCEEGETPCEPQWIAWVAGSTTTAYADSNVTLGTTYRYAVGANRGTGTDSVWSAQVTATAVAGYATLRQRSRGGNARPTGG